MRRLEFLKSQILVTHVSGIPVRIDFRWFFVLALMSVVTAGSVSVIKANPAEASLVDNVFVSLILGFLTTLVLFASIFFHELAHAFAARMEGVDVVEIVLHPFGGLARFRREPDTPRAEFRIAVAGPAASFLLAAVFFLLMGFANALGLLLVAGLLFILGLLNFLLAVFNLFPGYPLDGGRVLRAYLWRRGKDLNEATIITGRCGQIIAAGLIVFGILAALLLRDFPNGFWAVLVGLFLYDAARGIIADVNRLENLRAGEAMEMPATVTPETSVLQFVDTILPLHRQTTFLVAKDRQFYGVLMLEDLKAVPREKWREARILDLMRPVKPDYFVETDTLLADAKVLMRENGIGALGVIDAQGNLVGFLQRGRIRKRS